MPHMRRQAIGLVFDKYINKLNKKNPLPTT